MDYREFQQDFYQEIRSEKRDNIISGLIILIFGLAILWSVTTGVIENHTSGIFFVLFETFIASVGIMIIYWGIVGFNLSEYVKSVSDLEIEYNLSDIIKHKSVELISFEGQNCEIHVRGNFPSNHHTVKFFFDESHIYINARVSWITIVNFGSSKRLEKRIVKLLNKSC